MLFTARQKDRAAMEVTELVHAVKHPHPHANVQSSHPAPGRASSTVGEASVPFGKYQKSTDQRGSQTIPRSEQFTGEGLPKRHRSSGFRSFMG